MPDAKPTLLQHLRSAMPVQHTSLVLPHENKKTGLVMVDLVKGFCTVGCGNLAPQPENEQISCMMEECVQLAKEFSAREWPVLVFLDTHHSDKPEPPYPPHCIAGSGEESIISELEWLEEYKHATIRRKDCMDGFIGCFTKDGTNDFVKWVESNEIQMVLAVGVCTDICLLDFVSSTLSAKNHGMVPPLEDVVIYSQGCATFDIPIHVANKMPGVNPHPQEETHHMGLYLAQSRGAQIVSEVFFS